MEVFLTPGTGVNGDGSQDDPFTIDSTTDLNEILNGTYTNSTAASSGDELYFKDGDYSGLRINDADVNGVLFAALSPRQAKNFGGFGKNTSGGSADFNIEGLFFDTSGAVNQNSAKVTLDNCSFHAAPGGSRLGYNGTFDACDWKRTEFYLTGTYTEYFRNCGQQNFDNCTIVVDGTYGGTLVFSHTNGVQFRDCILAAVNQAVKWNNNNTFGSSSNNWVYNGLATLPSNIGTADPVFEDAANKKFRLNLVSSPCIGRGLGSWL